MLVIRKEQMESFEEYMLKSLRDRIALYLRDAHSEEASEMTEGELLAFVRTGIDKAESYGITEYEPTQRFVEYMLTRSPDFDVDDGCLIVQEILQGTESDGTGKMSAVDSYFRWEEGMANGR